MDAVSHQNPQTAPVRVLRAKRFGDVRGWFMETYSEAAALAAGVDVRFVQDNQSFSAFEGTIRGLHYQQPPHQGRADETGATGDQDTHQASSPGVCKGSSGRPSYSNGLSNSARVGKILSLSDRTGPVVGRGQSMPIVGSFQRMPPSQSGA